MEPRDTHGYLVYAKHAKEPALHECGEVHAVDVDDAVVFAHTLYDERKWEDMFVVPRSAVVTLIEVE